MGPGPVGGPGPRAHWGRRLGREAVIIPRLKTVEQRALAHLLKLRDANIKFLSR